MSRRFCTLLTTADVQNNSLSHFRKITALRATAKHTALQSIIISARQRGLDLINIKYWYAINNKKL